MIGKYFFAAFLLSLATLSGGERTQLRLSTYVTAHQVNRLFSSAEGRRRGLRAFRRFGITKVYLEGLRGGFSPSDEILRATRDFFLREGLEVSGGVATTSGKDFGVPSNRTHLFLNYEAEKTKRDMAERMRRLASLFNEIMVDDFFATDDASAESRQAKKDRLWSAYRLDLMTDFARKYMIGPPRPLSIGNWPPEVVDRIRSALPAPYGVKVEGVNSVGVCFFSGKVLVLSNFNSEEVRVTLSISGKKKPLFRLDREFPHVSGVRLENEGEGRAVVTVPPWDLSVARWER